MNDAMATIERILTRTPVCQIDDGIPCQVTAEWVSVCDCGNRVYLCHEDYVAQVAAVGRGVTVYCDHCEFVYGVDSYVEIGGAT